MKQKIIFFIVSIYCGIYSFAQHNPEDTPNVLFILVDDMGWKDTSYMGSNYYRTPNIDQLASESLVFTRGYAGASNCAPSRAALLSGMSAPRTGIYTVGNSDRGDKRTRRLIPTPNNKILADEVYTMAEMFQQAGYKTAHIGKWHLGGVTSYARF